VSAQVKSKLTKLVSTGAQLPDVQRSKLQLMAHTGDLGRDSCSQKFWAGKCLCKALGCSVLLIVASVRPEARGPPSGSLKIHRTFLGHKWLCMILILAHTQESPSDAGPSPGACAESD